MAIHVEHEKRKREILEKSLELFVEEGYEDVTFHKIAERCGITRTTLYIYFKNKTEIFSWSIKQLTSKIEEDILASINDKALSSLECLKIVFSKIFKAFEENKDLFKILLPYLQIIKNKGIDVNNRISRRTIRIQHLLTVILIRGQKNKELKDFSIKSAKDMLYGFMESAVFKLSVLNKVDLSEYIDSVNLAIDLLKA